jgi:hypothetical protein
MRRLCFQAARSISRANIRAAHSLGGTNA